MAKAERPPLHKRILRKIKRNNEQGARKTVLEELFNDFNRDRGTIYKINFFRGISFGLGSVLGGTIVVALIIWLLSILGHFFPPLHELFYSAAHTIESGKK